MVSPHKSWDACLPRCLLTVGFKDLTFSACISHMMTIYVKIAEHSLVDSCVLARRQARGSRKLRPHTNNALDSVKHAQNALSIKKAANFSSYSIFQYRTHSPNGLTSIFIF